jgi:hypothetical protein
MSRKANEIPTKKAHPSLPDDAYRCLEILAKMNRFGSNPNEVARHLILREIDDLTRAGVLPKPTQQV